LLFRNAALKTDRSRPLKRAGCRRFDHIKFSGPAVAALPPYCDESGNPRLGYLPDRRLVPRVKNGNLKIGGALRGAWAVAAY
jgi:hypothetical protein